jgi:hypothetical protein
MYNFSSAIESLKQAIEIKQSKNLLKELEHSEIKLKESIVQKNRITDAQNFIRNIHDSKSNYILLKLFKVSSYIIFEFIKNNKLLFSIVCIISVIVIKNQITKSLVDVLNIKNFYK